MDKRVPLFFSAFCSLMVGSSMMRTPAAVAFAGVGLNAAEKAQIMVARFAGANGLTVGAAAEFAPVSSGGGVQMTKVSFSKPANADDVLVKVADAVSAKGSDGSLEAAKAQELNLSQSGVALKLVSRVQSQPSGVEVTKTVHSITTDKRYLLYTRNNGKATVAIAVDESGAVVGRRMWSSASRELAANVAAEIAAEERTYWYKELGAAQVAQN